MPEQVDEIFGIGAKRKFGKQDVEVFLTDFRVPTLVLIKQIAKSHQPVIVINGHNKLSPDTVRRAITTGLKEIGASVKPKYVVSNAGLSKLYKDLDKSNIVIKTIVTSAERVAGIQAQLKGLQKDGIGKDVQIVVHKDQSDKAIKALQNKDIKQMRKYLGKNITGMFNQIRGELRHA